MLRLPRIQFRSAISHNINRGYARQIIFHDDGHYERITPALAEEVEQSAREDL